MVMQLTPEDLPAALEQARIYALPGREAAEVNAVLRTAREQLRKESRKPPPVRILLFLRH